MRTRLLAFAAAVILATLGVVAPGVEAAVPRVDVQTCQAEGGGAQYDATRGGWTCVGGSHDGEAIS
ncbi:MULTISPECIES: hypothetical protein [unclassified Streptomyces]|uniref:hypothetical protein n=1 Tax=unclassified Streptomyces TaxID=2593676 RepID=UPI0022591830|nr:MULTISPECIES: hypothetical protein [unclassified Streptomyces]MCX4526409.1 hypothetical protein [Streptomyces sp. NBC_01551]MCX4543028.1 hypothetical protein [Streptomyces sp. NBC_01565]